METKTLVEMHKNEETNMASYVHNVNGEYKVTLQDLDSGLFIPMVYTWPALEQASGQAKGLAFEVPGRKVSISIW